MRTIMKKTLISLALVLMMGGAMACAQQPEKKTTAVAPQTEAVEAETDKQAAPEAPATEQGAENAATSEPAAAAESTEAAPAPATDQTSEQEDANAPSPVN